MAYNPFFGYSPNPIANERYVARPDVGEAKITAAHLAQDDRRIDTALWLPLLSVMPSWQRGAQGIGDCVSWGNELCATMLMAISHYKGIGLWETTAATEAIYGGSRVEANGGSLGGYNDGSYGGAAAAWLTKWGVLLRKDYSSVTGNSDHNLTKYSSSRAKEWGNYGCGGPKDARGEGPLDKVARKMPIVRATLVTDPMLAAMAIQNGYPIATCSGIGYGSMQRNSDGICRISGHWAHCMMWGGVRWRGGAPQFRNFQSWGKSCSGPDPGIVHQAVSDCSWWITTDDAEAHLRGRDTFILSDLAGMPIQKLPILDMVAHWKPGGK